jgi:hypothetical protein
MSIYACIHVVLYASFTYVCMYGINVRQKQVSMTMTMTMTMAMAYRHMN